MKNKSESGAIASDLLDCTEEEIKQGLKEDKEAEDRIKIKNDDCIACDYDCKQAAFVEVLFCKNKGLMNETRTTSFVHKEKIVEKLT